MHTWGLTIDPIASLLLAIAIGLAVDYLSHIMHCFITTADQNQSKDERIKITLEEMGPPVFNGGFSTFLAFSLLAFSTSQTFTIFFKVFFLIVTFGLYNGLVVLPVILSLVGPKPIGLAH